MRKSASSSLARFPACAFAKIAAEGSRRSSSTASRASSRTRSIGSRSSMNARTSGRSSYERRSAPLDVLLERERKLCPFLELSPEHDERSEDESAKERIEMWRAHRHASGYAAGSSSPALRAQHGASRAGQEAGLDEELHGFRLRDRLAVEALDRKTFRTTRPDVGDERGECRSQPLVVGIAERDERPAAALDEERRLAVEEHDPGSGNACCASAGTPRPRQRRAVRLRRIGRSEHEGLRRLVTARRPELAEPLHRAGERELRSAEPFDEVTTPADAERLERLAAPRRPRRIRLGSPPRERRPA